MNVGYMKTPIGVLRIRSKDNKLVEIHAMQEDECIGASNENQVILEAKIQLDEYFSGNRKNFQLSLDMTKGSDFQQKVWQTLQEIPYGETLSYGKVASCVGSPNASRAVGNAVGANPFLIVVPCHRVIKGDGTIGGFSAGLNKKRELMKHEKIELYR